ncbi:MAG TPA: FAD binding domain-containing protein [Xanthobacteraceae bacterium]|nr:FAD binding domain-containing protein [Xanthobacteraceae bacterium]
MTKCSRALIIGGSISGLFAGLLLRRAGWQVDIFERSAAELAGRGAGIVTHAELLDALRFAGVDPDDGLGLTVETRRMFDREGRVIAERPFPQIVTSWDRVFRVLRNAFPAASYHVGKEFVRGEDRGGGITAHFADGTRAEGELLLGADGIRSTVRSQYLPEAKPLYAGYVAWRGLVPEREVSARTHADLFEYFSFCLPDGEQMLGYPVAGPNNELERGRRRYNFVWYRPADEEHKLHRLLTDGSGHTHQGSIPPPLVRAENIRTLRIASERLLAPQFQEMVALTPQPFLQPIYDLESPKIAFGRTAILGDAAFVARPHVGAGVAKAAADAIALVEALAAGVDTESALRAFERARIGIGRRIIERARHLGAYIQARQHTVEERHSAERYRTPDAVMAETATMDFLRG